jgi:hypothetical protein
MLMSRSGGAGAEPYAKSRVRRLGCYYVGGDGRAVMALWCGGCVWEDVFGSLHEDLEMEARGHTVDVEKP